MDKTLLTHEARCMVILAGGVLERCIEDRARTIAESRAAFKIGTEDVERATSEFLTEQLSDLPHLIQQAVDGFKHRSAKAA